MALFVARLVLVSGASAGGERMPIANGRPVLVGKLTSFGAATTLKLLDGMTDMLVPSAASQGQINVANFAWQFYTDTPVWLNYYASGDDPGVVSASNAHDYIPSGMWVDRTARAGETIKVIAA